MAELGRQGPGTGRGLSCPLIRSPAAGSQPKESGYTGSFIGANWCPKRGNTCGNHPSASGRQTREVSFTNAVMRTCSGTSFLSFFQLGWAHPALGPALQWGSGSSTTLVAPLARRAWSIEEEQRCAKMWPGNAPLQFWHRNKVVDYMCFRFKGELH